MGDSRGGVRPHEIRIPVAGESEGNKKPTISQRVPFPPVPFVRRALARSENEAPWGSEEKNTGSKTHVYAGR